MLAEQASSELPSTAMPRVLETARALHTAGLDVTIVEFFPYLLPRQLDEEGAQGALALMYDLQKWLANVSGFAAASLVPAAGAQGEFAGILMIRKYHLDRGDTKRDKILVPNSAHGTNPATTAMAGMARRGHSPATCARN